MRTLNRFTLITIAVVHAVNCNIIVKVGYSLTTFPCNLS